MKQSVTQLFESACGKARIFVENDMAIGSFHDFLMEIKGLMVDRMIVAHQEQIKQAEQAKILPMHESELSALPDQPEDIKNLEQQQACC